MKKNTFGSSRVIVWMAWKIIAIIGLEKTVCIFMWNVTTFLSFLWLSALLFLVTVPGVCVFHTYRYFVSVIWVFCLFVYCSRRVTLPLSLSLALPLLLTVCDQSYKINCNWFCRFENWYACLIFTIKPIFFSLMGNHKIGIPWPLYDFPCPLWMDCKCIVYVCYVRALVLPEE